MVTVEEDIELPTQCITIDYYLFVWLNKPDCFRVNKDLIITE